MLVSLFWMTLVGCLGVLFLAEPSNQWLCLSLILLASESLDLIRIWSRRRRIFSKLQTVGQNVKTNIRRKYVGYIESDRTLDLVRIPSANRFLGFLPEIETWKISNLDESEIRETPCIIEFEGRPSRVVRDGILELVDRRVTFTKLLNVKPYPTKKRG